MADLDPQGTAIYLPMVNVIVGASDFTFIPRTTLDYTNGPGATLGTGTVYHDIEVAGTIYVNQTAFPKPGEKTTIPAAP